MKQLGVILTLIILCVCGNSKAQPSAVKNAAKSVFKLTTYNADGTVLSTSHGVFVGNNGEAISDLKPFIGASKAIVTDSKGREMNVERIMGVNDIYDVAKFKVSGKTIPLNVAQSASASGSQAWLVSYAEKSPTITAATVKNVETFMDKYSYYIFSLTVPENTNACPFVNSEGQVIGIMQPSTTSTDIHATDAKFITELQTTGLSVEDETMKKIGIPPSLPTDKSQALLTLMMAAQANDSIKHAAIVSDFINQYPTSVDGYTAQAQIYLDANDFESAEKEMETAIKKVENKDEAHYNYSKIIYNKEVYKNDIPYAAWNLDKAFEEINKAYAINPQPSYQHQQALITYAKGEYQKAYDMFMDLTKTSIRNPELFYNASQCKQMLKAPMKEVIALLDSAITTTDTLRLREAAPYFLARAEAYVTTDSFRQAVFDYTRYEILVNGNVNANFYYIREQAEVKAKLYQQALIDISTAIMLAPKEPTYYAEKASLELRVNMMDDAIKTATKCIELAPEYADGYLILGLAQINKGDKANGMSNLEKAKELGHVQAQAMIEKYSK
jgi:tetratricopeptide (TPR) repeat protein